RVADLDGLPDAADRIIRLALVSEEQVRAGFAQVAALVAGFECLQEQDRELLKRIGYGTDVLETLLPLVQRQTIIVDFVEEMIATGFRPKQLADLLANLQQCLAALRAGRATQAPELPPNSTAREVISAMDAVVRGDLPAIERSLFRVSQMHPQDKELEQI